MPIDWEILSTPVVPKEHIDKISPLLPDKNSPLQANGNGNQSCYLAAIQDQLGAQLVDLAKPKNIESIIAIEVDKCEIEELAAVAQM